MGKGARMTRARVRVRVRVCLVGVWQWGVLVWSGQVEH
jgi:hypothetical protein